MMMIKDPMRENKLMIPILFPLWIITELLEVFLYIINKSEFKPSLKDSFYFLVSDANDI